MFTGFNRNDEAFTAVKINAVVFWVVTPCGLAGTCLPPSSERQGAPYEGRTKYLRPCGKYLVNYTAPLLESLQCKFY